MNLVETNHPALWTPAERITDFGLLKSAAVKLEALRAKLNAIGLAAPQVGIPAALFITRYQNFAVVFNPVWRELGQDLTSKPEASLSCLGFSTYVPRFDRIHAEWEDEKGKFCQADLDGMPSRVFQHMSDYLNGRPIFSRPAVDKE